MKSDPRIPFFYEPFFKDWLFYVTILFYLTQVQTEITTNTQGGNRVSLDELIIDIILGPLILTVFSLMAFVLFIREPLSRWLEKRERNKKRVTLKNQNKMSDSHSLLPPKIDIESAPNKEVTKSENLQKKWKKFREEHQSSLQITDGDNSKIYTWTCSCGYKKSILNNSGLPTGLKVLDQNHFKETMGL